MTKQKIIRWCWVLWLSTIFFLSFLPGDRLPDISWELISIDKLVHFGMYFILAWLWLADAGLKKMNLLSFKVYFILTLAGIITGVFVELIQGLFIVKRYFDPSDIVANGFGTIFGGIIYRLTSRKIVKINGC